MMASSTAIRLAGLATRGHATATAAALSTSAANHSSSVPSIAVSRGNTSPKRSYHQNASSSSTQISSLQRNSCNQGFSSSILVNGFENNRRWLSSKSDDQTPAADATSEDDSSSGSSQHNTWVEFQKSIAVSGFETGQTVREQTQGKKSRGGKVDRKRKEREAELEAALKGADSTQLKGGEFPSLRYSDEETERLLAQAYAAIPPRAGKRGTRNLKRQRRRWEIKRQYDATKKQERMAEHERRMAKRHEISQAMYNMRIDAVDVREKEGEYQMSVVQRWAEMNGHVADASDEGVAKMES